MQELAEVPKQLTDEELELQQERLMDIIDQYSPD